MPANEDMLEILRAFAIQDAGVLAPELADLLNAGVVEEGGCWFLRSLREGAAAATLATFPDRTGFEAFVNHIHIGEFVSSDNSTELHRQGLLWAERLRKELHGKGAFDIIVSCDESDCSVRFHRIRETEAWLARDLSSYKEEALLVIHVADCDPAS